MSCDHGFVVPEAGGFLCKECNGQFAKYPGTAIRKEVTPVKPGKIVSKVLRDFRRGAMTLADAAQKTTLTLAALTEAMESLFPPRAITKDVKVIGMSHTKQVVIGWGPRRNSCFKQVDDFVNSPSTTVTELRDIMKHFHDITDVEYLHHAVTDAATLMITFVDGSMQRVDVQLPRLLQDSMTSKFVSQKNNMFKEYDQ